MPLFLINFFDNDKYRVSLGTRQCGDEVDPCSEAETFPVEETVSKKVWTREQCLHQTAGVGGEIGPRPRRPKRPGSRRKEEGRSNSVDSGSSEDPSESRRRSSPMVITASLTIPMSGGFTLNLDDPDIPYIEETPKQPSAPPRRQRQRSISGCSEGSMHSYCTVNRILTFSKGSLSTYVHNYFLDNLRKI